MKGVGELDTLGAWLLERLIRAGGDPTRAARVREIFCGLDLQEPIEVDRAELILFNHWSE